MNKVYVLIYFTSIILVGVFFSRNLLPVTYSLWYFLIFVLVGSVFWIGMRNLGTYTVLKKALIIVPFVIYIFIAYVVAALFFFGPSTYGGCPAGKLGPSEPTISKYFGEESFALCGVMAWHHRAMTVAEKANYYAKKCEAFKERDQAYQKFLLLGLSNDSLPSYINEEQEEYVIAGMKNSFGIIEGTTYGFDFSEGERTTDLSRADIYLQIDGTHNGRPVSYIKSASEKAIYLDPDIVEAARKTLTGSIYHTDSVYDVEGQSQYETFKDKGLFFVRTMEGNYAKVAMSGSMYGEGDHYIEFDWVYQPSGSKIINTALSEEPTHWACEMDGNKGARRSGSLMLLKF